MPKIEELLQEIDILHSGLMALEKAMISMPRFHYFIFLAFSLEKKRSALFLGEKCKTFK